MTRQPKYQKHQKVERPWPFTAPEISGDDAAAAGCCQSGIARVMLSNPLTSVPPRKILPRIKSDHHNTFRRSAGLRSHTYDGSFLSVDGGIMNSADGARPDYGVSTMFEIGDGSSIDDIQGEYPETALPLTGSGSSMSWVPNSRIMQGDGWSETDGYGSGGGPGGDGVSYGYFDFGRKEKELAALRQDRRRSSRNGKKSQKPQPKRKSR